MEWHSLLQQFMLINFAFNLLTYSGMIGITEPRRVAAVAMSQRVAKELNLSTK